MSNILDKIIETKRAEVAFRKITTPEDWISVGELFSRTPISLKSKLLDKESSGIIAEFKKKSPSKGVINDHAGVRETTNGYVAAGAAGLSVLTDSQYFGGQLTDLKEAKEANPFTPVLRKDFIVDTYQITEAKAFGADLILLIAASLSAEEIDDFAGYAKSLQLEVLLEIHDESELGKISPLVDLVGVNNRNLKNFEVNVETSLRLAGMIPDGCVKISESGISSIDTIHQLKKADFKGFLIGETFMKTDNPAKTCAEFINELKV